MKTILALETSCDETAVAILRGSELLASEVASQVSEHERYGGVVPEVASRNHLIYAPRLLERAAQAAKIDISQVDAFAATSGPGLASSLMIGASIAKGLAIGFGKPYLAINHLEGHLLSPFFPSADPHRRFASTCPSQGQAHVRQHGGEGFFQKHLPRIRPNMSLVVSGGHTMSIFVRGIADYQIIGRTVDDAAGEAFDKVAKLLGLGYPGGPEIEKLARNGNPTRFGLPRSMPGSENFSFSGLKTAVRYLLPKIGFPVIPSRADGEGSHRSSWSTRTKERDQSRTERSLASARDDTLNDLCASFQQAIIGVLIEKTIAAAKKHDVDLVTLSGGVSCNRELRKQLREACKRHGFELKTAEPWLCTDNAAMIAFAAMLKLKNGASSSVTEEIDPNLAVV